jgi:hypothetical protein
MLLGLFMKKVDGSPFFTGLFVVLGFYSLVGLLLFAFMDNLPAQEAAKGKRYEIKNLNTSFREAEK